MRAKQMKQKSPRIALAIASVFANLINKATFELSAENILVLESLQRANPALKELSISEIGNYLSEMSEESMRGLANNVKGIYHELLFVQNENTDGDEIYARIFPDTNHPGADVILQKEGIDVAEIQLKATDNISYIEEHYVRYPETPIFVTSEISENASGIPTGISNEELESNISNTFRDIEGQRTVSQLEDAAMMSGVTSAIIHAGNVLKGKTTAKAASMETLKDVGAAVSATALLDILFL